MRRKKLFWQVYIPNVLIVFLALIATSVNSYNSVKIFNREQLAKDLELRARLTSERVLDEDGLKGAQELDEICREYGRKTEARITVVAPSGLVLADSERPASTMEDHGGRPEVIEALKGNVSHYVYFSRTLKKDMMYLGMPLSVGEDVVGVMRVSLPLTVVEKALKDVSGRIVFSFAVVIFASLLAGIVVSRNISRPLEKMKHSIMQYKARGPSIRVEAPDSEEMAAVAEAVNAMVAELDNRVLAMTRQSNEQRAVLSSMREGLLAIDGNDRILQINGALLDLLGTTVEKVKGRSIQEAIRNVDLQAFAALALESRQDVEGDIVMHLGQERRYFQAHGTALYDAAGERMGALIVLNDLTRIRKLEAMRRDFVANVSHELKTPITSIKGFVETLREDLDIPRDKVAEFLEIIFRQTDRLNAIIDDILVLSRLEFEAEEKSIDLAPSRIAGILRDAVEACTDRAKAREMTISMSCQEGIQGNVNARLIEQAVINLLDNAIKYSDEGCGIRVEAAVTARGVEIAVIDQGHGMEEKHKDRIFERFYRVDKARSRGLGGTGLGLAIVKHIVIAHRGNIEVESKPGQGSVFRLILPAV